MVKKSNFLIFQLSWDLHFLQSDDQGEFEKQYFYFQYFRTEVLKWKHDFGGVKNDQNSRLSPDRSIPLSGDHSQPKLLPALDLLGSTASSTEHYIVFHTLLYIGMIINDLIKKKRTLRIRGKISNTLQHLSLQKLYIRKIRQLCLQKTTIKSKNTNA